MIARSLKAADVALDLFGHPARSQRYAAFIRQFVTTLHGNGSLRSRTKDVPYCTPCDRLLFEAHTGVEIACLAENDSAFTRRLIETYRRLIGEPPGGYFLSSYVAMDLLLGALRAHGDCGGREISEHLKSQSWTTVLGVLDFTAAGDVQGLTWRMARVIRGRFT